MIARDRSSRAAARNNADWCDSLCRTHGIPGRFDPDAWVDPHRTPRHYPDAVTLDPAAIAGSILGRIDTSSPGCSIKDSFATLDLGLFGFQMVHEGHELLGLSNVFTKDEDLDRAWSGSLEYLDTALPGLAIVGYASGADLSVAHRRGFQSVGALRIWLKEP